MNQPNYTQNQIKILLRNKNVLKFSGKYLAYTPEFKIKAIDQFINKGISSRDIFAQAGFDLAIIGKDKPWYLMHDWLKVFKEKGNEGFRTEQRGKGGKGKSKSFEKLTDKEKIKRLELKVLYLKKENDFLVKLRARLAE